MAGEPQEGRVADGRQRRILVTRANTVLACSRGRSVGICGWVLTGMGVSGMGVTGMGVTGMSVAGTCVAGFVWLGRVWMEWVVDGTAWGLDLSCRENGFVTL
jgi:hypothetical protein